MTSAVSGRREGGNGIKRQRGRAHHMNASERGVHESSYGSGEEGYGTQESHAQAAA